MQAATTLVQAVIQMNGGGWYVLDEPVLCNLSKTAPAPHSTIVSNGTFESSVTGWDTNGSATLSRSTTQAHSGLASMVLTHTSATNSSAKTSAKIAVTPGAPLRAKAWVKAPSGHQFRLIANGYVAGGAFVEPYSATATATGGWDLIQLSATLGLTVGEIILEVNKATVSGADTPVIYIDDVDAWLP